MYAITLGMLFLTAPEPRLEDLGRFPARASVTEARQFNRAYRSVIHGRYLYESHHRDYWEDILLETDQLYALWDCLDDAQCQGRSEAERLGFLRCLRDQLGAADYAAGQMPPCVPLWRFEYISPIPSHR